MRSRVALRSCLGSDPLAPMRERRSRRLFLQNRQKFRGRVKPAVAFHHRRDRRAQRKDCLVTTRGKGGGPWSMTSTRIAAREA